jgi:hypothetical protein
MGIHRADDTPMGERRGRNTGLGWGRSRRTPPAEDPSEEEADDLASWDPPGELILLFYGWFLFELWKTIF